MDELLDPDLTQDDLVHDLNNVFETITEAAELLNADRRWKALAAALCRSVARGKRLLGALPDNTPNLASIVGAAIESVTDYCIASRKPRLRFIHQLSPDVRLPGSAKDWERVFVNLFLNAAEIMKKPGRIDIGAQLSETGLTITVSDNGPGIPAEILSRIFLSSFSTKKNRSGRSGLGLHIVASIVRKYSGRVTASNREKSNGAVFTISLPSA